LIRRRGHEIGPESVSASPAVAHASPEDVLRPDSREGTEN